MRLIARQVPDVVVSVDALSARGAAESFVSPVTSDFRLFVPLVFSRLGEDGLFDLVDGARPDFRLGPQEAAWREAAKYIVGWAEESLAAYRDAK